tara:strand:+ start:1407 stop:1718 length:312 start_codon:yes stop_codon:yes gene_type:complete
MTTNEFEKKMLNEIDFNSKLINEKTSFLSRLLTQLFKKKMDRLLKKAAKGLEDEPDLKAAVVDYHQARDKANDALSNHCKRNPDSFLCTGKAKKALKSTKYGR